MFDSSENDLEYSFTESESENLDFENLANHVKDLGLELYQFDPIKQLNNENHHFNFQTSNLDV